MTAKTEQVRDWITFGGTLLTLLIIPVGMLILRDQRYQIMDEVRHGYVAQESFVADHNSRMAENAKMAADIIEINAKLSNIQITITRLSDSAGLKDSH
jgi:hypothetical protein